MLAEDKKIKELIEHYSSGIISTDEFIALKENFSDISDSKLQELLSDYWDNYSEDSHITTEKKDKLYKKIHKQIEIKDKNKNKRHNSFVIYSNIYKRVFQVAAAILLIFSVTWAVKLHFETQKMYNIAEQNIKIQSGKSGSSYITLPDGTNVLLNSNSELTYKQDFGLKDRKVSLSGEGFFEVAHDNKKKFIVKTGYMDITVLGTKFNVYAYENNDIVEMVLLEGSVQVNTEIPPYKNFTVKPNEKVTYNKLTGDFSLQKTDNKIETAWMNKTLIFNGNKLKDVFSILERKFGVNIIIDNENILEDIYSGTFDDNNIENILNILKIHYSFEYNTEGSNIYIKTK